MGFGAKKLDGYIEKLGLSLTNKEDKQEVDSTISEGYVHLHLFEREQGTGDKINFKHIGMIPIRGD